MAMESTNPAHTIESLQWAEYCQRRPYDEDEIEEEFVPGHGLVEKERKPWYVIQERNKFRQAWNLVLVLLLSYTGTIFPYRLCFVTLNMADTKDDFVDFWDVFDVGVDVLFYIDLLLWFFFSFRSPKTGKEVFDIGKIVRRYLKTFFFLNAIACIPPPLFQFVVNIFAGSNDSSDNSDFRKTTRLSRLQRVSRLARLARVIRLVKLFDCSQNHFWKWFQSFRYIRIVNFVCCLFWVVHLVGCGWYLTAWFHEDPEATWVYRRGILESDPYDQWVHAGYFVLTVFTTVGFGDMSAYTLGEIYYVSFTMVIGAVVHSIVMSEVINILLSVDQRQADMKVQKDLVKSFTDHVKLDPILSEELLTFFEYNRSRRHQIDRDRVKSLLTSSVLPRELMELLVGGLFEGELENNAFMVACLRYEKRLPVRFPLLLALALNERNFSRKEMVYCAYDHPWNIFLVVKGTFAYIAFPSPDGGLSDLPADVMQHLTKFPFGTKSVGSRGNGKTGLTPSKTSWSGNNSNGASKGTISQTQLMKDKTMAVKQAGQRHGALYPYQVFGPRSYFGDLELLLGYARTRFSGARCEFEGGQLLVLHKSDLNKLMKEFGRFGHAWHAKAKRREEHRRILMARLLLGRNAENLAAETIQRYWRRVHGNDDGSDMDRARSDALRDNSRRIDHLSTKFSAHGSISSLGKHHDRGGEAHELLKLLREEMNVHLHTLRHEVNYVLGAKQEGYQSERLSGITSASILNVGSFLDAGEDAIPDSAAPILLEEAQETQVECEKEVVLL